MADLRTIARLADLHEWAALKEHFAEEREEAIQTLARKTFAQPEFHDRLKWEQQKAFWHGVDAVLSLPEKERDSQREESQ